MRDDANRAQHPGRMFSTSPQHLGRMRIGQPSPNQTHFNPQSLGAVEAINHNNGTGNDHLALQLKEWQQANVFADDLYPNTTVRAGVGVCPCQSADSCFLFVVT